jgi:riboflavin kinase/FMN adenylyltransferase
MSAPHTNSQSSTSKENQAPPELIGGMHVYRSLDAIPAGGIGPSVVTIGNFDGVHRGHQWVIAETIARARSLGLPAIAITFDPHPARVLRPELPHAFLTPVEERLRLLAATGLDGTLLLPFTTELSQWSARRFVEDVLVHAVGAREVHEGENFRFGYQAEADIGGLETLGRELGFRVCVFAPQTLRRGIVSSSRIRHLLQEGHVEAARALLGRPFAVASTPAPGRGYGTRYTVPTINLAPYAELLPANGVYITTLKIGSGDSAECFDAVTNVGNRPTFGADSFTVESHLLNFHPLDLTAETPLRLTFLKRLRGEEKWPSPEALREQIGRDVRRAQAYFRLMHALVR